MQEYDQVWDSLVQDAESERMLKVLSDTVAKSFPEADARRMKSKSFASHLVLFLTLQPALPSEHNEGTRNLRRLRSNVQQAHGLSTGQLLNQAAILTPFLRAKVADWAVVCKLDTCSLDIRDDSWTKPKGRVQVPWQAALHAHARRHLHAHTDAQTGAHAHKR